jgi:hypothetical protein
MALLINACTSSSAAPPGAPSAGAHGLLCFCPWCALPWKTGLSLHVLCSALPLQLPCQWQPAPHVVDACIGRALDAHACTGHACMQCRSTGHACVLPAASNELIVTLGARLSCRTARLGLGDEPSDEHVDIRMQTACLPAGQGAAAAVRGLIGTKVTWWGACCSSRRLWACLWQREVRRRMSSALSR